MKLTPITPGEILRFEYMEPIGLTAEVLARESGILLANLQSVIDGDLPIDENYARAIGARFGTTASMLDQHATRIR